MEKLIGKGILWLACVNPCIGPQTKNIKEKQLKHHHELSTSHLIDIFNDTIKIYDKALESSNLTDSNKRHLLQIQMIIRKFEEKFSSQTFNLIDLTPALNLLHESLEKDLHVWKKYQEKNKIPEKLVSNFSDILSNLSSYCIHLKTS